MMYGEMFYGHKAAQHHVQCGQRKIKQIQGIVNKRTSYGILATRR